VNLEASRVGAAVVRPLRHAVLRTGRSWAESLYPADDDPMSAHFAVQDGSTVLAVGSVLPESPDWHVGDSFTWRVRGMATRQGLRGSGLGGQVLEGLLSYVTEQGGGLVWMTARIPAVPFYERYGFVSRGARKQLPGIGPHLTMFKQVG
jgi:predicted GNAT family N-acyltransferase